MRSLIYQHLPWVAYPGTVALIFLAHLLLVDAGMSLLVSTYIPVIVGALLVTLLEYWLPHERRWKPGIYEVVQDSLYMVLVQTLLPKLFGLSVVFALISTIGGAHAPFVDWWPHHLPIGIQAVIMVLGVDFLRYWFHRATHGIPLLWRLHAVHHAPTRLYWLNVARVHPIEKVLTLLFDTLPFILVGVSEPVVALYFIFYAVTSFFQHSNIELRYGVLNYIISSAELHRWHHSRIAEEFNRNFGSSIIIWDIIFGTWFLPENRKVSELGLSDRNYPSGFLAQMAAPIPRDRVNFDDSLRFVSKQRRS